TNTTSALLPFIDVSSSYPSCLSWLPHLRFSSVTATDPSRFADSDRPPAPPSKYKMASPSPEPVASPPAPPAAAPPSIPECPHPSTSSSHSSIVSRRDQPRLWPRIIIERPAIHQPRVNSVKIPQSRMEAPTNHRRRHVVPALRNPCLHPRQRQSHRWQAKKNQFHVVTRLS